MNGNGNVLNIKEFNDISDEIANERPSRMSLEQSKSLIEPRLITQEMQERRIKS